MHAGIGAIAGRIREAAPEVQQGAFRAATAQVLNDKPVDVADLFNHGEASTAADALETWHAQQQRMIAEGQQERAAAAATLDEPPDHAPAIAAAEANLGALRSQSDQLSGEVQTAQRQATIDAMEPDTRARFDQVQAELGRPIPPARRAALEQEHALILEGQQPGAMQRGLETARSNAQASGLSMALSRVQGQASDTEAQLSGLKQAQAQSDALAAQQRASADRATRISQARQDARTAVVQGLMEREVRKFAGRTGVTLEPGEATQIASEIRTAQPAEVSDTIAAHLNALAQRSTSDEIRTAAERQPSPLAGLRAEAAGAARDMAQRAIAPVPSTGELRTRRANADTMATAPEVPAGTDQQTAEAQKLFQDAQQRFRVAMQAGVIPAEDAELAGELAAADALEGNARAALTAAACLAGRGF